MKWKYIDRLKFSVIAVIVILITLVVGRTVLFKSIERVTMDLRFRFRGSDPIIPSISLVLVDSTTIDKYDYPVPRRYYAVVAKTFCENGARAVVIDRTFEARDPVDIVGGAMFNRVLEQYENVICGWFGVIRDTISSSGRPVVPDRFAMPHDIEDLSISPYRTSLRREEISLPYYDALKKAKWLGSIVTKSDDNGTRIEKVPLVVIHGDRIYPSISLAAVCVALNVNLADIKIERDRLSILANGETITIPIDEKGQVRVNYMGGRPSFIKNKHSLSVIYESILSGYAVVPLESFKNTIVLIGNDDVMGADMYSTPFGDMIPGVAIHATVIDNILQGKFIDEASWYLNLVVLIISIFLISNLQELFSPRGAFTFLILLLAFIWVGSALYFRFWGVLANVSQPTFGVIFAFAGTTFYNYVSERKKVNHIRQIFGKHVSQEIVDRLVVETDGQVPMSEREVSVLFADISDHSRLARDLDPSEFAEELNKCLETMSKAVSENEGIINCFLGDGFLALYNAPIQQDDHAFRAVKTGLAIQENISKLNEKRKIRGKKPVAVRVGINTGRAMAGTLGSADRLEYTVVGDTVNMAKRTEGECEPGKVAITDSVLRKIGDDFYVKTIGLRHVKGRESGLMLYHVICVKDKDN
jgi:adenylate cyclase